LDMRLLLNILTETKGLRASLTILSLFDVQFRQIFKPQLEKVVSIAASRGRKSLNVKWREPYGAILASLAMDQSHMMYVAEISPPTENDEFLKMMPACDEIACVYSPDTELPDTDNNNNDINFQGRQSRNSVISNSDASIISYSTVTSSVSTSSTGSTVSNPDTDITVVESLHSSKERKKERQRVLYNDDLDPHRMNSSNSPYHAIFRNLRLDIDYKITISFLLSGHCIGLVDFTVMAEKRKTSFELPGERKDSNISSVSTDTSLSSMLGSQIGTGDQEQDFHVMKEITEKAELDQYIAGFGKDDVSVLVIGAQWCQICVRMRPGLERLAIEQPTVKFLYVDFSQVPSIKEDFSIAAFPTLYILRGENVMEKIIGDQIQILTKKLKFYTSFRKMSTESTCSEDSCSAVIPPESSA